MVLSTKHISWFLGGSVVTQAAVLVRGFETITSTSERSLL